MKKSFLFLLISVLIFVFLQFPGSVLAESASLENRLIESCSTGQSADLSDLSVTTQELESVHRQLYLEGKYPWYTLGSCSYTLNEQTGFVIDFHPDFLSEAIYNRELYARRFAEILDETVVDGMSQLQIALSLHDYIVAHTAYDETHSCYESYDALVNGKAVCSGYARAYMELLHGVGIPAMMVETPVSPGSQGHAWVLLCLDGSWYHADPTWDDPTPNAEGRVEHTFFLLTDAQILSGDIPHFQWANRTPETGKAFQSPFWTHISSQISFDSALNCYYRRNNNWTYEVICRNPQGDETVLHSEPPSYVDAGDGYKDYEHGSLSLWNSRLYFNSMETLYSMELDGSDLREEYTWDAEKTKTFIRGAFVYEDQAVFSICNHETLCKQEEYSLPPTGYHVHSYQATVIKPTCIQSGCTRYSCACGLSYEGALTPPLGHSYRDEIIVSPSYGKPGTRQYTCLLCGDTYTQEIPALTLAQLLKHDPVWLVVFVGSPLLVGTLILLFKKR